MEINLENREKILSLLEQGICPICDKKFKKPLSHISRGHGISKNEVKDLLMISHNKGFAEESISQKYREVAKKNIESGKWVNQGRKSFSHNKITKDKQGFLTKESFKNKPQNLEKFKEVSKIAIEKQLKPVIRISVNGEEKEYISVNEAARKMHIDASSICKAIRGKRGRTQVAGYKWKYKDI